MEKTLDLVLTYMNFVTVSCDVEYLMPEDVQIKQSKDQNKSCRSTYGFQVSKTQAGRSILSTNIVVLRVIIFTKKSTSNFQLSVTKTLDNINDINIAVNIFYVTLYRIFTIPAFS